MKPFDLEAAMRGDPIVCRDGTSAKFIAHVPETNETSRILYLVSNDIKSAAENGMYYGRGWHKLDLFMSPKKRTVWVNFYGHTCASYYDTQEQADKSSCSIRIGKAWPVEIEE